MARQAAEYVQGLDRPVTALVVSPLQRTRESAEPFTEIFGLEPVIDERVIEPTNVFEGRRMVRALAQPAGTGVTCAGPRCPSWGEPYNDVIARMNAAMTEAWECGGRRATSSSCRISCRSGSRISRSPGCRTRHDPRERRCALSSVTSFEMVDDKWTEVVVRRAGVDGRRRRRGGGVMRGMPRRGRWRARHPLCSSALVAALAACTNDPLAEQYRSGDNKGFIAADGFAVVEIPADERGEPVVFEGTTEAGDDGLERRLRRRRARRELLVRRLRSVPGRGRRPRGGVLGVRRAGCRVPRHQHRRRARGRRRLRRDLRRHLPERHRRARTARSSSRSPSARRSTPPRRRSCSTGRAGSPRASSGSSRTPRCSTTLVRDTLEES